MLGGNIPQTEVVVVSFATDGGTEDLAPVNRRGPISVAQLLEREGFQPATRSKVARRALSGVAAGAVLALGAVVGSLLLNHGTQNTNGDTLASGGQSGGDIVFADSGVSSPAVAPATSRAGAPAGSGTASGTTQIVQNGSTGKITVNARTSAATHQSITTGGGTSGTSGTSGGSASGGTPATTSAAPTPTASTGTSTSTPPSSATSSAPTSTNTSTTGKTATGTATKSAPTSTTSSSGGLLGTVTGTLSSVTDPVFSWFGS